MQEVVDSYDDEDVICGLCHQTRMERHADRQHGNHVSLLFIHIKMKRERVKKYVR
jgi:hypothetical protein